MAIQTGRRGMYFDFQARALSSRDDKCARKA